MPAGETITAPLENVDTAGPVTARSYRRRAGARGPWIHHVLAKHHDLEIQGYLDDRV